MIGPGSRGTPGRAEPEGRPGRSSSSPVSPRDRKSTRLNSSHGYISYAVFCLKKKNSAWTAFVTMAVGAGIGVILEAWYVLRFYQGSLQESPPQPAGFGEMRVADGAAQTPLLA